MSDDNIKVTVYSPESNIRHPGKLISELISELKPSHELGLRLANRNIKALYRQSFLGYFWSIAPPLITSLVWIFLRNSAVINIEDPGVPYPLFVLLGTMLWQIFTESVQAPLKAVTASRSMLTKINFPRTALILSGLYETFFNTLIKIALIISFLIFFQYIPDYHGIFSLLGILALIVLGSCIGLLLTPIGMLYQDIQRGITVILQFAIYLTPVIYPAPKSGIAATLMQFNPVAPILTTTRNIILGQELTGLNEFITVSIIAFIFFIIGLFLYRLAMPIIIERVGS